MRPSGPPVLRGPNGDRCKAGSIKQMCTRMPNTILKKDGSRGKTMLLFMNTSKELLNAWAVI